MMMREFRQIGDWSNIGRRMRIPSSHCKKERIPPASRSSSPKAPHVVCTYVCSKKRSKRMEFDLKENGQNDGWSVGFFARSVSSFDSGRTVQYTSLYI
jgi:hypothetical protein